MELRENAFQIREHVWMPPIIEENPLQVFHWNHYFTHMKNENALCNHLITILTGSGAALLYFNAPQELPDSINYGKLALTIPTHLEIHPSTYAIYGLSLGLGLLSFFSLYRTCHQAIREGYANE